MSYTHGLSTQTHDAMSVDDYYGIVYNACREKRGGLFVDVFSGGGRDIQKISTLLGGDGKFIAIDSDPQRIQDMTGKQGFVMVDSRQALENAFKDAKIAVVGGTLPERPYGTTDIDLKGRADFILCNAGIMFVRPDQLEDTLKQLSGMLAPQGEMVLRFSLKRDDQSKNLGIAYFVHDPKTVENILGREGMRVERREDLPDPAGRPFSWVDIHVSQKLAL